MKRIEFTTEEKAVIQQQLNGEIEVWSATDEQQKHLSSVIDKAGARLDEYPDDYDFGDDLVAWIWREYQAQEANA